MQQLSNWVYRISTWLIMVLVGIMACVTLTEVIARNVFHHSFSWSEEVARFTLVWLTFIGASAVYKRKELVGFDMFMRMLPSHVRKIASGFLHFFTISFILVLTFYGLQQTFSKTAMIQHTPGLQMPMFVVYMSIPLGMLMTLVHAVALLVEKKQEGGADQ
ncbi:TRAP transporter small permease [Brevibacillus ruminantium]|uniref:TRAP transporter small permease n=1 Tax=Brevibacillus ruminantium TaxID=2950604 RepID=A0ABY4WJ53_9BACL|nr:TRAP transporter small permease [Brevibacillus ruminantium]USG64691.1 TRAP transporter small permease [Brevibacillus ruminantium]